MRIRHALLGTLLAAGTLLAGCRDLDVTDPNAQDSSKFWKTKEDANAGITAAYNGLLFLGTYSRWHIFANDIRSDIGTAQATGWGELRNWNAFQLSNYDFEVNRDLWANNYELIGRANQVIGNVPAIDMDPAERDRIVAEAKFLRALGYFNLVTLFENIPVYTSPPTGAERPAASPPAETWALIEQDLKDAAAVLPTEYDDQNEGRATKGAALAMLGKVQLQMAGVLDLQAKWGEAAATLAQVVALNKYRLLQDADGGYQANFLESKDFNNPESVFEVSTEDKFPIGVTGISFPKMIGACGPGFTPTYCDARPTRWYFEQFQLSKTATGDVDPRMDVTILYDRADRASEVVFGHPRSDYFTGPAGQDTMLFFRKYAEWQTSSDQRWDNPINYKVIRYADVLLMQAEALLQSGGTNPTAPLNLVRARVGKAPVASTVTGTALRDTILMERMFELGLEASRFNDLRRYDLLTDALKSRDKDFDTFQNGKSERLPIPSTERNLNPNLEQNPFW
jgi:starch-binding outer membrane protein, SusD/RagB family